MSIEVRKTLVWGTTAAAVLSAATLAANSGGMPRIASLVGDSARARVAAVAETAEAPRPVEAVYAAPANPAH